MKRLVQLIFLVVWLAGAVTAELTIQTPEPNAAGDNVHLLAETDRADLGVKGDQVILIVETPWHSEWRIAAPVPAFLAAHLRDEAESAARRTAFTRDMDPPLPFTSVHS